MRSPYIRNLTALLRPKKVQPFRFTVSFEKNSEDIGVSI